jgi:lipoprotein-anchoring transpeptidase ErfK/SrfK
MTRLGTRAAGRGAVVATVLLTGLSLVGCGQIANGANPFGSQPGSQQTGKASAPQQDPQKSDPEPTRTTPPPDPFKLSANIKNGADDVEVDKTVTVKSAHGKLTSVKVQGKIVDHGETKKVAVEGKLNAAKTAWTATERLEPTGDYTVKMSGTSDRGGEKSFKSTFSTEELALDDQVFASFAGTMSGTVGVGTPVVLRFDLPVTKKALVEKHLKVTNTSGQKGSWHWYSDQEVHWRPANYWKPGTKVSASADLNSLPTGEGRYGQMSTSTSFTVGDSVVTKVNLKKKVAVAYLNGKKARTIPISAGAPGKSETRSGIKLITEKRTDYTMTSEMIGLPKTGPESYELTAEYALRITNSGEFLHTATWNSAYFGKKNASHGCTGMSIPDSRWLYKNALPGSPVEFTGSDRELEPLNGLTDWNADFETYAEGSAL